MGSRAVIEPNLPINAVKTVLIGEKYAQILGNMFKKNGISVIKIPDNLNIAPQISSHADMSVCHIGGNKLVIARSISEKLRNALKGTFEIIESESIQVPEYPGDIALNACVIGDKIFHTLTNTDKAIKDFAKQSKIKCFDVKQGYTKCSVCILNRNNIITSDKGIHALAETLGIRSLLICGGFIELSGYDTGFIGGSCGKISEKRIAFTGRLERHPDETRILDFIGQLGIEVVYLTDKPVFDIGSIIPIEEYY